MTERERVRRLDAMVAHHLFKWKVDIIEDAPALEPGGSADVLLPYYSRDIAAAWLVHQHVCDRLFSARGRYFSALQADASAGMIGTVAWPDVLAVLRERFPEAVCRAALAAVGVNTEG